MICYFITDKNKERYFYLFVVSKIGTTVRGARTNALYDSLQIWGMKILNKDFSFISINKKKWTDSIAGIFNSSPIKDRDFSRFYLLGNDPLKTTEFLNPSRKTL